jgi:short-chain Z-isoprenyl diphosphate synthase
MRIGNPLYSFYNRRLQEQLQKGPLPRHLGLILDGNRRFARRMGYDDASDAYTAGGKRIDELLEWCAEFRIPVVTLWLLSTDNLPRDPTETCALLSAIEAKIVQLTYSPSTYERRYRIRVLGRLDGLPASIRMAIREAEERTREHDGAIVNLAIGYGGREEIIDAVSELIQAEARRGEPLGNIVAALTTEEVARHLYTGNLPDPDLIIRTSGEVRLSGFLLWQSAHSEFYFCDAYWPAFRKVDFLRALRSYQQRQRRFGGDGLPKAELTVEGTSGRSVDRRPESPWLVGTRLNTVTLTVRSTEAPEFIDITERVEAVLAASAVWTGGVWLYSRHTSAGLTINENEPLLLRDMGRFLDRLAPPHDEYGHDDFSIRTVNMTNEETPNGHSHCQGLVLNTSEFIPVREGRLQLGLWQRVFLVELDCARERQVLVQVFGG